jgi:hypothetical protein
VTPAEARAHEPGEGRASQLGEPLAQPVLEHIARAVAPSSKAFLRRCSGVIARSTRTYMRWFGRGLPPVIAPILCMR